MKTNIGLASITSVDIILHTLGQYRGTDNIDNSQTYTETSTNTSSTSFTEFYRAIYTIGEFFNIYIVSIHVSFITNNSTNGICKFQISGDGGATYQDITSEIGSGLISTSGSGLWINTIQTGRNKLVIRSLMKSSDSKLSFIRVRSADAGIVVNQRLN